MGAQGVQEGTNTRVLAAYFRGTLGVLSGYFRGTKAFYLLSAHSSGTAATCGIYASAHGGAGGRACVCVLCHLSSFAVRRRDDVDEPHPQR